MNKNCILTEHIYSITSCICSMFCCLLVAVRWLCWYHIQYSSFQKCVKVLFHFLHFTDTDWTREVQLLLCYHCLAVSYMFNFLILKVTLCCLKTYLSIKLLWLVSSVSHLFNHLLRRACTDLFCPWLLKISKHEDKIAAGSLLKRALSLLSPS